jgi:hypothetical protein
MSTDQIQLSQLPCLADLFRLFNSGKHLNRVSEPALWAEVEREQDAYTFLFSSLGFELSLDARGFAWFYTEDGNANTSKTSRHLALLFMVLFEFQADAGRPLLRFGDWRIDKSMIDEVYDNSRDLLVAEELDSSGLISILVTAERYGFAVSDSGHWRLLPAVCRYLDHFEELAQSRTDEQATDWLEGDKAMPQEGE